MSISIVIIITMLYLFLGALISFVVAYIICKLYGFNFQSNNIRYPSDAFQLIMLLMIIGAQLDWGLTSVEYSIAHIL